MFTQYLRIGLILVKKGTLNNKFNNFFKFLINIGHCEKKLIIINSLFYDNLIFEKHKFDKYLNNELIEVEF